MASLGLAFGAGPAASQPAEVATGTPIVEVRVVRHDVFDLDDPETSRAAYRWTNRLHVLTHENFIRSVLLFEAGDPLDPLLLAESELLLRGTGFLNPVTIRAHPVPGGAEVVVETRETSAELAGRYEQSDFTSAVAHVELGGASIGKSGVRLRAAADIGHDLDGDRQLTLGADTGLRGYDPDMFDGTSRLLANVEWRRQITGEFRHVAVLGVTAFADGGKTWGARVEPSTDGWRGDAGVGLLGRDADDARESSILSASLTRQSVSSNPRTVRSSLPRPNGLPRNACPGPATQCGPSAS